MQRSRKGNPLGVGLTVVDVGTTTAIEGSLMLSVPVTITGRAISIAAPAAWVLWAIAGLFLSLGTRLRRPPQANGSD